MPKVWIANDAQAALISQQRLPCRAVERVTRRDTPADLELAQGRAGLVAEKAIGRAHILPAGVQPTLEVGHAG